MKKVVETTRPFRYDLNQIPYDYTVEVRNRFKGLDLVDRVPDELWTEVCDIVQETGIKTSPKHPVSCIEPGVAIRFIYDIIHVSMPFSQIIPPSPSPTESKGLF